MTPRIVTLTLNPAVDVAYDADSVRTIHKVRTYGETHDPGGGGVNVARVVRELGGDTLAIVLAGGVTGKFLEELLIEESVPCRALPISGRTRIAMTIHDRTTGLEYRFVPEGPMVSDSEWRNVLDVLAEVTGDWLVASGSLPSGVPEDAYATIAELAVRRGFKVALDTSGPALRAALGHGVTLIKPSHGEFEALLGQRFHDPAALDRAALALVREGKAELVAVTLGADGALLAHRGGVLRMPPVEVQVRGAVGAGDSFLAGMVLSLARGEKLGDALAWGAAAGAAAVMRTGTAHPRRADVEALFERVRETETEGAIS